MGPTSYAIDVPNTSEHASPGPMALGSDGSLYVVGRSGQSFNPQPTVLLRINPSTGAERNRRSLNSEIPARLERELAAPTIDLKVHAKELKAFTVRLPKVEHARSGRYKHKGRA